MEQKQSPEDLRLQLLVTRIESAILQELLRANACPTCALKAFAQVCTDMVQIFEQQQVISKEDAERLLTISKNK